MLPTMDSLDDDAGLMLRYKAGDAAAFSALYAEYKGPLYRYLLRHVHNAGAAFLVISMVTLLRALWPAPAIGMVPLHRADSSR